MFFFVLSLECLNVSRETTGGCLITYNFIVNLSCLWAVKLSVWGMFGPSKWQKFTVFLLKFRRF